MVTLVYKMTHKGDPDPHLGHWGVEDCMGRVRAFKYDAVIGIGGRSWWTNQTNRAGEVIWIGIGPQKKSVQGRRGPMVTFAHFLPFKEGELTLGSIAPKLDKAIHHHRFKLSGFSPSEQQEIEHLLKLAKNAKPSKALLAKIIQRNGENCCRKVCRR
jgi:hypothetical protein